MFPKQVFLCLVTHGDRVPSQSIVELWCYTGQILREVVEEEVGSHEDSFLQSSLDKMDSLPIFSPTSRPETPAQRAPCL